MTQKNKMTWAKESGFIFAMIGSAVGFANILAFSAQCYKNGGGAFLIPFLIAIVIIGLPMLILEGVVGKTYGLPIVSAYGKILPRPFKIFGWISAISCLTIGSFYSVLTSWSVAYTYFASTDEIPKDTANFFANTFLRDSGDLLTTNGISLTILISTCAVAFFTYVVVSKNIGEGVEKVCSFFLPLLFLIVLIFSIMVAFLPGAMDGFINYLKPDFSKLKDFRLWRDIFGHVFFSFSLGIGIVVGYARHTKQETNMKKAMIYVAIGDVLVSLISGFAIFGCIGYLSHKSGIPFEEIVTSDSTFEMGFIIFPEILQTVASGWRQFFGAIFFFCIFIAGITGVFSIVESVAGNIEVEFQTSRKKAVLTAVVLQLLMSIPFCMGNGTHIIGALTPMVMGYIFLIGGMAQIITFIFLDKKISSDPIWLTKNRKQNLTFLCVKYIGFAFLVVGFFGAVYEESLEDFSARHLVRWGWFALCLVASILAANYSKKTLDQD